MRQSAMCLFPWKNRKNADSACEFLARNRAISPDLAISEPVPLHFLDWTVYAQADREKLATG
jgi:hypothetical protein